MKVFFLIRFVHFRLYVRTYVVKGVRAVLHFFIFKVVNKIKQARGRKQAS